ncbi:MAG TPA: carbohydrate ABC transporter permease [Solirubrobacteraceae bacterium]|jgi:cellobiose transport system permease protein|nr:carbohydrate ABC transporter permease [Solirubrobacteraceae bacterium]
MADVHVTAAPLPAAASRTAGRHRRHLARRFRGAGPGTYLLLALIALVSVFPLYWSLVVASHSNSAVAAYPPVLVPGGNLIKNIDRLFNSGVVNVEFWKALMNSAIVATTVAVAAVMTSAMAGFAFAKLRFRGNRALFLAVVVTMMVPVQLGVIPLYIEMIHFHWLNKLQAVIAPNVVSAFGVFFMRQYIVQAVPNELVDAARVDGCNTMRIFWHVVLPAVRPAAAVLGLLTFLQAWNDYFWPLVVLSSSNPTVQVAVSSIASVNYFPDYALVLTGTFVSVLPLLVLFLVLGRQIIGGIMQGAVKA